jgi:hypothetical protein
MAQDETLLEKFFYLVLSGEGDNIKCDIFRYFSSHHKASNTAAA